MFLSLLKGFSASSSLVIAIGAQNAFVIRQGIQRRHLFLTAILCSSLDAILIFFGALGFGKIISAYPFVIQLANYFAILFLTCYGALSLKSAFKPKSFSSSNPEVASAKKTILLLLAFTLLNPHVYLDTVILLGSIALGQPYPRYFALGAISASFCWFFALTYGSHLLTPLLQNPRAWQILDILIALMMWTIALSLLLI